jgi:iron-sulfur cluster assembly protein
MSMESPSNNAFIAMTEKAAGQIRQLQERENRTSHLLRVSVVGGGCSGLSYKLSFDETPKEKDKTTELHGIRLVSDPKSLLFLKGMVIDFTDGLDGQGFVFQNPNAKQSCGCGTSFSA